MESRTLGVILAGGLSRRMGGGDKALLRLGGRTLLERVAERLAPQCAAGLILSANGDPQRFAGFPGPIVPDGIEGHPGPLAGILAALDFAAAQKAELRLSHSPPHPEVPRSGLEGGLRKPRRSLEGSFEAQLRLAPQDEDQGGIGWVVSVSGDAPFLPRDLVARLHAARDGVGRIALAASSGRKHYTVALWPLSLGGDLRSTLESGERRVGAFITRQGAAVAEWPSEPADPFLNVNTPDDLEAAEAALARLS